MITIETPHTAAKVFTDRLDPGAEGLIHALCGSPVSQGSTVRIMPDVHAGRGSVIGTTMTLTDKAAPGLVGVDIGCGMLVLKVKGRRMELQKLDKVIRQTVPAGRSIRSRPHRFAEEADLDSLRCGKHVQKDKARLSIGTLGGGNHFIELDKDGAGGFWLIIHSGSRHLGVEVSGWYQELAFQNSPEGTPYELSWLTGSLMADYLHDMALTQRFAEQNRRAIADEIVKGMKWTTEDSFSTVHNYIDPERMILRKGAVSAEEGERLIIPLNMRDGCLLCVGKGNPDWNRSAPHGAGRLMRRSDARQSFTLSRFKKEMDGIFTTSISRETLDECPMAYKPMEEIVSAIGPTAAITEHIRPVYSFKAGTE